MSEVQGQGPRIEGAPKAFLDAVQKLLEQKASSGGRLWKCIKLSVLSGRIMNETQIKQLLGNMSEQTLQNIQQTYERTQLGTLAQNIALPKVREEPEVSIKELTSF